MSRVFSVPSRRRRQISSKCPEAAVSIWSSQAGRQEEHPWGTPAEVRVVEPPCVVYQPNIEGAPLSPADVADPAVIMALARRQAAQLHQRYGEKSAGGLLIEATVRRDSINICHLGDLDAAEREAAA